MITVCLTHDIDRIDKTYQYITKPLKALRNGDLGLFLKRLLSVITVRQPYWGFNKIIEIEKKHNVKSTCFFLNESIKFRLFNPQTWILVFGRYSIYDKRVVNIIQYLDGNGWEIGVHGSYNSYNNYELLKYEKDSLEKIVGHKVIGIRQHYLNLSDKTWEIQNKAGFKYDSTWGHTDKVGFKDRKIQPFFPISKSDFCEIPMTIMDGPFASMKYRWEEFERIVDEIDKNNAYLVINYHNNNFDRLDFPSYEDDYAGMLEILRNHNAQFMTMNQAYRTIINGLKVNYN